MSERQLTGAAAEDRRAGEAGQDRTGHDSTGHETKPTTRTN
jgi:hypothetical protein